MRKPRKKETQARSLKTRPIRVESDVAYVPLTRGYESIIDTEDIHLVVGHNWWASLDGPYALRAAKLNESVDTIQIRMHRVICPPPQGLFIDHINGNGLDNRKVNLRFCTKSQNTMNCSLSPNNTSGYKGVQPVGNKFRARIGVAKERIHIGYFENIQDAVNAYDEASKQLHKEFRRT